MNYRLNKYTSATNYKIAGGTDLKDVFEWGGYTPSISNPGASSVSPTKETVRINGNFYKAKVTINGTDYWLGSGSGGSVTDWSNTAATVTVTGLSSNTAYNDKTITVYNYFGDSVTSSVSFTTIDIARITSIDKSGEPTTSRIDVSAAGNSSTIYIIVSCSNGSSQRINASSGTVQFTSGLNPGTSYTFTATPYDADGNAGETKQTSISTAKPPAPTVSITKSGTAPSDPTQSIVVSCTASTGTATVNYSGGTAQSVTADGSAHDYTFTGLTPNTKYTFTVTSTDSYGQTSTNSTDITTDQAAAVLPVVTSFTGTATSSTNITLTIVADANTSYVIIKCTSDPNNVLDVTNTTNGSTTQFDRNYLGLTAGTPYTFTATPYTSGNVAGTTTGTLTVSTATTIPAKPTVTISKNSTTSVQIVVTCTVSNGTATVNYTGGTAQSVTADGAARDYTFSGLTPNTKYTFTVTSTDSYGEVATASTDITTDQAVGPVINTAKLSIIRSDLVALTVTASNMTSLYVTINNITRNTTPYTATYTTTSKGYPGRGAIISDFSNMSNLNNVIIFEFPGKNYEVAYDSVTMFLSATLTPYDANNNAGTPVTTSNTITFNYLYNSFTSAYSNNSFVTR
jgi:hypothetical protein